MVNCEARLLAAELSKLTGESMTTAVTIAVREDWLAFVNSRASASPIDFWRLAGTARRASRSRSVPLIMATSFMTNADYGKHAIAIFDITTMDCMRTILAERSQRGQSFQSPQNAAPAAGARQSDRNIV
jgi:hypothetical protein